MTSENSIGPIFIGGSGCSATGAVFHWLGEQPEFSPLFAGEAKFLVECDGLVDLHHALTKEYNATRALTTYRRFHELMTDRLLNQRGWNNVAIDTTMDKADYLECVEAFCGRLLAGSTPRFLEEAEFFEHCRRFLWELYQMGGGSAGARMVEKTPHNLLHMSFLRNMYPSARFLHVVRDPRDVAMSLLRQPWGPDNLENCSLWLKQYFNAYDAACRRYVGQSVNLFEIKIEEMTSQKLISSGGVREFLGGGGTMKEWLNSPDATYFRWKDHMNMSDRAMCNSLLGDIITRYGYEVS